MTYVQVSITPVFLTWNRLNRMYMYIWPFLFISVWLLRPTSGSHRCLIGLTQIVTITSRTAQVNSQAILKCMHLHIKQQKSLDVPQTLSGEGFVTNRLAHPSMARRQA